MAGQSLPYGAPGATVQTPDRNLDDGYSLPWEPTPQHPFTPGTPKLGRSNSNPEGVKSPVEVFNDDTIEGRIARLEKRLKRNLPNEVRVSLELEVQRLKQEKVLEEQGLKAKAATPTVTRRKIGAAVIEGPEGEEVEPEQPTKEKKKKLVNRAAPVIQHPKTMARMKDWQKELDRRIKEQQELDGKGQAEEGGQGWLHGFFGGGTVENADASPLAKGAGRTASADTAKTDSNPLAPIQELIDGVVEGISSALGLQETKPTPEPEQKRTLPPQTFSRRL